MHQIFSIRFLAFYSEACAKLFTLGEYPFQPLLSGLKAFRLLFKGFLFEKTDFADILQSIDKRFE